MCRSSTNVKETGTRPVTDFLISTVSYISSVLLAYVTDNQYTPSSVCQLAFRQDKISQERHVVKYATEDYFSVINISRKNFSDKLQRAKYLQSNDILLKFLNRIIT